MIVVTVFPSILNQMDLHLVQNRKENCHHHHIPFNVKGKGNIVYSDQPVVKAMEAWHDLFSEVVTQRAGLLAAQ